MGCAASVPRIVVRPLIAESSPDSTVAVLADESLMYRKTMSSLYPPINEGPADCTEDAESEGGSKVGVLAQNSSFEVLEAGLLYRERRAQRNLLNLAKNGDAEQVKAALEAGADVNTLGMWGNTALITACMYGHAAVCRVLLEFPVDVNRLNEKASLHECVRTWMTTKQGASALLFACMEGMTDIAAALLSRSAKADCSPTVVFNPATDSTSSLTPLGAACVNGHLQVVQLLLSTGLSPDQQQATTGKGDNCSCLMLSCMWARGEITSLLLEHSALLSTTDKAGRTALHHACAALAGLDCVRALLHIAIRQESPSVNYFVNAGDLKNNTALHLACESKHLQAAAFLLVNGADANVLNSARCTPLHVCVRKRSMEMVQLLLEYNANPTLADDRASTPIDLAKKSGRKDILDALEQASPPSNVSRALATVTAQGAMDEAPSTVKAQREGTDKTRTSEACPECPQDKLDAAVTAQMLHNGELHAQAELELLIITPRPLEETPT